MKNEEGTYVEQYEHRHETSITPVMVIKYIKVGRQELVGRAYTAELAGSSRARVLQVTAIKRYVRVHILGACLPRRRRDADELDRRTVDLLPTDS